MEIGFVLQYLYIGLPTLFLAAVIVECICKKQKMEKLRPSYYLNQIDNFVRWCWEGVAKLWVWISGYLSYPELWEAFYDLLAPIFRLCFSFLYFVFAYFSESGRYSHPFAVYIGSGTIIGAVIFLIYKYVPYEDLLLLAWFKIKEWGIPAYFANKAVNTAAAVLIIILCLCVAFMISDLPKKMRENQQLALNDLRGEDEEDDEEEEEQEEQDEN